MTTKGKKSKKAQKEKVVETDDTDFCYDDETEDLESGVSQLNLKDNNDSYENHEDNSSSNNSGLDERKKFITINNKRDETWKTIFDNKVPTIKTNTKLSELNPIEIQYHLYETGKKSFNPVLCRLAFQSASVLCGLNVRRNNNRKNKKRNNNSGSKRSFNRKNNNNKKQRSGGTTRIIYE